MRRAEGSRALFASLLLALAIVSGFALYSDVAAQAPEHGVQPGQWDRWNPNWMQRQLWGPGQMGSGMQQRMARHKSFMHEGSPKRYRGAKNPLSTDPKTIADGRILYGKNCGSCHGADGTGEGKPEKSLISSELRYR